jgi:hypothetical protein
MVFKKRDPYSTVQHNVTMRRNGLDGGTSETHIYIYIYIATYQFGKVWAQKQEGLLQGTAKYTRQ